MSTYAQPKEHAWSEVLAGPMLGVEAHPALAKDTSTLDDRALLEHHLDLVEEIVGVVARRNGLDGADAEDFRSEVLVHLMKNDQEVLRRFSGRSSLATFLSAVIENKMRDFRNSIWGKWRPSVRAKELGPPAVRLEALVYRDAAPVGQAVETVSRERGVPADDLYRMLEELPRRWPKSMVPDSLATLRSPDDRTDDRAIAAELRELLEAELAKLPEEDQLVFKMRDWDGFTVRRIAAVLGLNERRLYSRIKRSEAQLREALMARGVRQSDLAR